MPGHSMPAELEAPVFSFAAESKLISDGVGCVLACGPTVPTDATAGYQPGCLFIHTDGDAYNTVLYCNISTAASCDFNVVTIAQ